MNMRYAMFVTVLSGMLAATSTFAQTPPPTTHIGVVNMVKVFHSLQETKDVEAKLEADNNSLKSLKDEHQATLTNMEQEIRNGPKPDTDQYDTAVEKLDQTSVQYESELKLKQVELTRNQTKQLKSIFDKIETSVADIAKSKGLDLVLTEMKPELAPGQQNSMTPDQLSQVLTQRNVLYAGDNIDITSDVIAAMDAKYKAGGK
jgi:Skp family chaperone for outer membrane proteins